MGRVALVAVPPRSPRNATDYERWRRGLRALPRADPSGFPRIMAGDYNATLDHRELRDLIGSGYVDVADALGDGLRPTWPETRRLPAAVAIDHVLIDPRFVARSLDVRPVLYTDHRALVARVALPTSDS
jgi:endonuclease/exonuclease/phosphatase family metal-dependent hydrolase